MRWRWAALAVALVAAAGCSGPEPSPPPATTTATATTTTTAPPPVTPTATGDLGAYTDPGDGCEQAVSAIAYADDVLVALGQEPFQQYTDAVRSRLAGVSGTLALEERDWPSEAVARQAAALQPLADAAAGRDASGDRAAALLRYRLEATRLVLLCRGP